MDCKKDINNYYNEIKEELTSFQSKQASHKNEIDDKTKFFRNIGDLVTTTEETLLKVISDATEKFESDCANTTENELRALHQQSPETIINQILNRITVLDSAFAKYDHATLKQILTKFETTIAQQNNHLDSQRNANDQIADQLLHRITVLESATVKYDHARIEMLETKIANLTSPNNNNQQNNFDELEARITQLEASTTSRTPSRPPTTTQQQPSSMFQSPTNTHRPSPQPIDNGSHPGVARNSLIDFHRGLLRLNNIRVIDSYMGHDTVWRYTAVTSSNTIVNDITATDMNNIRSLDALPPHTSHPPTSQSTPPFTSSNPTRSQATLPFKSHALQHHHDDASQDDSSSSEPIITFVGHQYRYPRNSRTMSRVNYSYITDKGSKWNLTLNR